MIHRFIEDLETLELVETSCDHNWINKKGNYNKPCIYCYRYPSLKLRFQCQNCYIEACKFCLEKENQTYNLEDIPEPSIKYEEPVDHHLERRIRILENKVDRLEQQISNSEVQVENFLEMKPQESSIELLNTYSKEIITLKIIVKVRIKDYLIEIPAIVDTVKP